jgi:hypothetical protein
MARNTLSVILGKITALFADNTNGDISEAKLREVSTDISQSFTHLDSFEAHTGNTSNPHGVTKAQVGLSDADNTSDRNKPVSDAQQAALDNKADLVSGKIPSAQLPSYVDDVIEVSDFAHLPSRGSGETGKIYVTLDENKTYRWSGSSWVEVGGGGVALGETSSTAYRGDRGKTAYDHTSRSDNPHAVTQAQVGLSDVNNTSDMDKPVSTAQSAALAGKMDLLPERRHGTKLKFDKPAIYGSYDAPEYDDITLDDHESGDGHDFVTVKLIHNTGVALGGGIPIFPSGFINVEGHYDDGGDTNFIEITRIKDGVYHYKLYHLP